MLLLVFVVNGCAGGLRHVDEDRVYMPQSAIKQCNWPFVHGCKGIGATFDPQLRPAFMTEWTREHQTALRQNQDGLEIALDEYASVEKSHSAFDSDVARNGVLPLLVSVDNRGTNHFKIRQDRVQVFVNGEPLRSLYGYEAARQGASRDYVWRALASAILAGPLAMYFSPAFLALSANHTNSINKRIERHFESLELTDALLKPNESTAGFVYFKIPDGSTKLETLFVEITVEIEDPEDRVEASRTHRLALPAIELSR
jgi:hypothetical protein